MVNTPLIGVALSSKLEYPSLKDHYRLFFTNFKQWMLADAEEISFQDMLIRTYLTA